MFWPDGQTKKNPKEKTQHMNIVNWNSASGQWDLVELCVRNAFATFIEGAPGLGKTFAGLAASAGERVYQITFNPDSSVQEYQGTYIPTENGTWVWRDGPILTAFREGGVLVLNEMGRASDAVLDFLIAITDSKESAKITLMNGETVVRHPMLRIVATSNSPFSKLPEALQDRFEARLKVTVPHPRIVQSLNAALPGLGSLVANAYDGLGSDKQPPLTSREAFAYARLRAALGPEAAAQAVWGVHRPALVEDIGLAVETAVRTHGGAE